MSGFSEKRIGNWTFSVAGHVFPLPPDLAGRVKQTVPNRAERRRAARHTSDQQSSSGQRHRVRRGSSPQGGSAHAPEPAREWPRHGNPGSNPGAEQQS